MEIEILDYASAESLRKLCEKLNMPQPVTEQLVFHALNMDLKCFASAFRKLFAMETGVEAVTEITALCKTEDDRTGDNGLKALTVYMMAAQHTYNGYIAMGIEERIFLDTMKTFSRFVNEHKVSFAQYGFDRDFWIYRLLALRLFRLGELEFEMHILPPNADPVGVASTGDAVLKVHIPSDAVITRESLDASYESAKTFYAYYFPSFQYKCMYCSSWLLSPILRSILKPSSRILAFQSDYTVTFADQNRNDGMKWVFKKDYECMNDLPEDTSLMRALKGILISGGKIGNGTGYLIR